MDRPDYMSLAAWADLAAQDAAKAAREVVARVQTRLPAGKRDAVIAWLASLESLTTALAAADSGAPLAGIPYFLKDLFDLAGVPTRAGSIFLDVVRPLPNRDSEIVVDLRRAGAACAGKTHLHEFALGLTGENPHFGDCPHPLQPGRLSGGSSSGSAAVVAAGIVPLAFGTDTGGSIRVPAAFCGLYGFRLTPGHRWIADAFPLSATCDTPGWFTASAADLITVQAALVGSGAARREPRGLYLPMEGLDPDVDAACADAARDFARGAAPEDAADLRKAFAGSADIYSFLTAAEAARVHASWLDSHRSEYDPAVWKRLDAGRRTSDADLEEGRNRLRAVRHAWGQIFNTHDFLVLAAVPFPAPTKAESTPENRRRLLELNAPASLGGLPVLTVPVKLSTGLTVGLQVVVPHPRSPAIPWVLQRCERRKDAA